MSAQADHQIPPIERDLLMAAQKGDREAQQSLIERHTYLLHAMARRYVGLGAPLEDLLQAGRVGFLETISKANLDGPPLKGLASFHIRREMIETVQRSRVIRPARKDYTLDATTSRVRQVQEWSSFDDHSQSHEDEVDNADYKSHIASLLSQLDSPFVEVVRLRLGFDEEPLLFKQIGERLGFSGEYARVAFNKAITTIRRRCDN